MSQTRARSLLLGAALVVIVALLAGSYFFVIADGGDVDPENVNENMDGLDTYTYESTQTLQSEGANDTVTISGEVDRTANEAVIRETTEATLGIADNETVERYLVDGTEYIGSGTDWERTSNTDEMTWHEFDPLLDITGTLDETTLDAVGTETINGIETEAFEATINESTAAEFFGFEEDAHIPLEVEEIQYVVFIDPETEYLHAIDIRAMISQGGEPALVTTETTISDHDEAVSITLPDEAESNE